MKLGLTQLVSGHGEFVEISESEYLSIKNALKNLKESLNIEQKYSLVIENYHEYEISLLYSSASRMLFENQNYDWLQTERMKFIRKISNILSSCRLYLDQIEHNIHNIYKDNHSILELIRSKKNFLYDSQFGYRVLETLRNYMQHRNLPINVTFIIRRIKTQSGTKILYTCSTEIDVKKIDGDGGFKKQILNEMKGEGEIIDFNPLLKEYIFSISWINNEIREMLKNDEKAWEQFLNDAIERYSNSTNYEDKLIGLAVGAMAEDGTIPDYEYILAEVVDHKNYLINQNKMLVNLQNRIVSSDNIEINT